MQIDKLLELLPLSCARKSNNRRRTSRGRSSAAYCCSAPDIPALVLQIASGTSVSDSFSESVQEGHPDLKRRQKLAELGRTDLNLLSGTGQCFGYIQSPVPARQSIGGAAGCLTGAFWTTSSNDNGDYRGGLTRSSGKPKASSCVGYNPSVNSHARSVVASCYLLR